MGGVRGLRGRWVTKLLHVTGFVTHPGPGTGGDVNPSSFVASFVAVVRC